MRHLDYDDRKTLVQLAIEAIPNLTMPHSSADPDDQSSSIEQRLQCFQTCVREWRHDLPFIITIARSANDGFTPKSVVEELQTSVLKEIHERYCGCDGLNLSSLSENGYWTDVACRLHVVFDDGKWEGSILIDGRWPCNVQSFR